MNTTKLFSSRVCGSAGRRWRLAFVVSAFVLFTSIPASAVLREYRVSFLPSVSANASGYMLFVGRAHGVYSASFDLGSPPSRGWTIVYAVDLEDSSDLYVALTAYDALGKQSAPSNEIRVLAFVPPPVDGDPGTADPGTGGGTTVGGTSTGGGTSTVGGTSTSGGTTGGSIASGIGLGLTSLSDGMLRKVLADGTFTVLTLDSLASTGDLRPVTCDLDGDGDRDLVVGFGRGSGGQIAVIRIEKGAVIAIRSIEAGPDLYRTKYGETFPACGDLDGDGIAEIVVGFERHMQGVVQVFSSMASRYKAFKSTRTDADGYMQIPVPASFSGSTHPAIGDIDGDGRGEVLVGMDGTLGGYLTILDDSSSGFKVHPSNRTGTPWIRIDPSAAAAKTASSTFPALGDLDGDGRDEIAVSFGRGSEARIAILNDAVEGFFSAGLQPLVVAAGRPDYQLNEGETRAALSDIDGDGRDELIVGFRGTEDFELQVFDDLGTGMSPMTTSTSTEGFVTGSVRKAQIHPIAID